MSDDYSYSPEPSGVPGVLVFIVVLLVTAIGLFIAYEIIKTAVRKGIDQSEFGKSVLHRLAEDAYERHGVSVPQPQQPEQRPSDMMLAAGVTSLPTTQAQHRADDGK